MFLLDYSILPLRFSLSSSSSPSRRIADLSASPYRGSFSRPADISFPENVNDVCERTTL